MKIADRKTLVKILRANGYSLIRHNKHEVYSNGKHSLALPCKRRGFSRMVAERLIKEAGLK